MDEQSPKKKLELQQLKRILTPDSNDMPPEKICKISQSTEDENTKKLRDLVPTLVAELENNEDNQNSEQPVPDNKPASGTSLNQSDSVTDNLTANVRNVQAENVKSKHCLKTAAELNVPPFNDTTQLLANSSEIAENYFGNCIICKNSFEGKKPLLLGCLHSCCSKCILQRGYFYMSNATPITAQKRQPLNSSGASLEVGVNIVPDEAFKSLDALKTFISESKLEDIGKLVVKCPLCHCGTRAKVILENRFSYTSPSQQLTETNCHEIEKLEDNFCTNCDENSKAVRFCKDCEEHLCEECVNAHKRVKLTKEHTLQDLQNSGNKRVDSLPISRRCNKHAHEVIKLFCESCNMLTCRDCQLESHRDHRYLFVQEAAESHNKILETMAQKLSEKKFFLDQTSDKIKSRLNIMLGCREKAFKDIVSFHTAMQERLTSKCQNFVDRIQEATSFRHRKMSTQFQATDRLCTAVDHCIRFIKFASEENNNLALLDSKQMVMEYMTTVMRQKFTTDVSSSDIVFEANQNFAQLISTKLGNIIGNPQTAGQSRRVSYVNFNKSSTVHHITPNQTKHQMTPQSSHYRFHNKPVSSPIPHHIPGPRLANPVYSVRSASTSSPIGVFATAKSSPVLVHHLSQPNSNSMQQKRQLQQHMQHLQQRQAQHFIRLQRPQQPNTHQAPISNVIFNASIPSFTSVRRSSFNDGAGEVVVNSACSLPEVRPFVSRPSGPDFNIPATFRQNSEDHPPMTSPVTQNSSNFIHSIPERLDIEPSIKSFLGEVAAMTQQQVLPTLSNSNRVSSANVVNVEKCGSISSGDSGFASAPNKTNENPLSGQSSSRKQGVNFSPPPLVDLSSIIKMEEVPEQPPPPLEVEEEKTREDSESDEIEKMLFELVEGETNKSLRMPIKKEASESPPVSKSSDFKEKNFFEKPKSERKFDPNEDWCAVCNNGGDLLCCDTCPKVFHLHCHVPEIITAPPGSWQCMLCKDIDKMLEAESKYPKRKRTVGLNGKEQKVCEKLLLELFCHSQSIPFHTPVRSVPIYYKIIKEPMDLTKIKKRLTPHHFQHYITEREFLQDIQLIFFNCFCFNGEHSEISKMGLKLQEYFVERVQKRLPEQLEFVKNLISLQKPCVTDDSTEIENNEGNSEEPSNENVQTCPQLQKVTAERKSMTYESDTLWQPEENAEEESSAENFNLHSEEEEEEEDDDTNEDELSSSSSGKEKNSEIIHIK